MGMPFLLQQQGGVLTQQLVLVVLPQTIRFRDLLSMPAAGLLLTGTI
jgi:hypothetical protein